MKHSFKKVIAILITYVEFSRTMKDDLNFNFEDQIYSGGEKIAVDATGLVNDQDNDNFVEKTTSTSDGVKIYDAETVLGSINVSPSLNKIINSKLITRNRLGVLSFGNILNIFEVEQEGKGMSKVKELKLKVEDEDLCREIQPIPAWDVALIVCQKKGVKELEDFKVVFLKLTDFTQKVVQVKLANKIQSDLAVKGKILRQNKVGDQVYFIFYANNPTGKKSTGKSLTSLKVTLQKDGTFLTETGKIELEKSGRIVQTLIGVFHQSQGKTITIFKNSKESFEIEIYLKENGELNLRNQNKIEFEYVGIYDSELISRRTFKFPLTIKHSSAVVLKKTKEGYGVSQNYSPKKKEVDEYFMEIKTLPAEIDELQISALPNTKTGYKWVALQRNQDFSLKSCVSSQIGKTDGIILMTKNYLFKIQEEKIEVRIAWQSMVVFDLDSVEGKTTKITMKMSSGKTVNKDIKFNSKASEPFTVIDKSKQFLNTSLVEFVVDKKLNLLTIEKQENALNLKEVEITSDKYELKKLEFKIEKKMKSFISHISKDFIFNCTDKVNQIECEFYSFEVWMNKEGELKTREFLIVKLQPIKLKGNILSHEFGCSRRESTTGKQNRIQGCVFSLKTAKKFISFIFNSKTKTFETFEKTLSEDLTDGYQTIEKFQNYTKSGVVRYYNEKIISKNLGFEKPVIEFSPSLTSSEGYFCIKKLFKNNDLTLLSKCNSEKTQTLLIRDFEGGDNDIDSLKEIKLPKEFQEEQTLVCTTRRFYVVYNSKSKQILIGDLRNIQTQKSENIFDLTKLDYGELERLDCLDFDAFLVSGKKVGGEIKLLTVFHISDEKTLASVKGKNEMIMEHTEIDQNLVVVDVIERKISLEEISKEEKYKVAMILLYNSESQEFIFKIMRAEKKLSLRVEQKENKINHGEVEETGLTVNGVNINQKLTVMNLKVTQGALNIKKEKKVERLKGLSKYKLCDFLKLDNANSVHLRYNKYIRPIGEFSLKYDYPAAYKKETKNGDIILLKNGIILESRFTGSGKHVVAQIFLKNVNKPKGSELLSFKIGRILTPAYPFKKPIYQEKGDNLTVLFLRNTKQEGETSLVYFDYNKKTHKISRKESIESTYFKPNFKCDILANSILLQEKEKFPPSIIYTKLSKGTLKIYGILDVTKGNIDNFSEIIQSEVIAFSIFRSSENIIKIILIQRDNRLKLINFNIEKKKIEEIVEINLDLKFNFGSIKCEKYASKENLGHCVLIYQGYSALHFDFSLDMKDEKKLIKTKRIVAGSKRRRINQTLSFLLDNYYVETRIGNSENIFERELVNTLIWNLTSPTTSDQALVSLNYYTEYINSDHKFPYSSAGIDSSGILLLQMNNETKKIQSINKNPSCDVILYSEGQQSSYEQYIVVSNGIEEKSFKLNDIFTGGLIEAESSEFWKVILVMIGCLIVLVIGKFYFRYLSTKDSEESKQIDVENLTLISGEFDTFDST